MASPASSTMVALSSTPTSSNVRCARSGHDDGAENWAILASLIETAKLSGIDPQAWLADILARLVNLWPNNRLDQLSCLGTGPPRADSISAPPESLNRPRASHLWRSIK
jgi:transposase IS66-like protein